MPLPKSITSLLTAIVVAIPAAITTLALNKPKPPKEIDAVIELDENKEIIDEQEIKPTPQPTSPPKPPESPQSSSETSSLGGGKGSDDSSTTDSSDSNDSSPGVEIIDEGDNDDEHEEEVEEQNGGEEEEEEKEEEESKGDENEQTPEDSEVPEPSDSQKDPTLEELQNSIKEIMQKIIDEGKSFNSKDSSLYSLYTIKTGLETLPGLFASLKTKMDQEKNKATTESGGSEGSQGDKSEGEQS